MDRIDWAKWEKWSEDARKLDVAKCECYFDCDCEKTDFQKWLEDFLHVRSFIPPCVRPVNKSGCLVLNTVGVVQGPYTFEEWFVYGQNLIHYFHLIVQKKAKPDWSKLYFRDPSQFYAGSYSHFCNIGIIYINTFQKNYLHYIYCTK